MIPTVVVGHGLAGRAIHCPLIRRQKSLQLVGVVARDPRVRAEAEALWEVTGFAALDEALADSRVRLVVIATPHDSHAELSVRALEAGKDCVVDKVMALSTAEADRMIAARDASGRMLSVFHNRRWDWDYVTLQDALARGRIGRPLLIESSVCRFAPPRTWRGQKGAAGTILHDWGAHLIDQALQLGLGPCRRLSAWIKVLPAAAGPEVDSGSGTGGSCWKDPILTTLLFQGSREQPGLPPRSTALVGRRDGRGVRQVRRRSPGRRPPRR